MLFSVDNNSKGQVVGDKRIKEKLDGDQKLTGEGGMKLSVEVEIIQLIVDGDQVGLHYRCKSIIQGNLLYYVAFRCI